MSFFDDWEEPAWTDDQIVEAALLIQPWIPYDCLPSRDVETNLDWIANMAYAEALIFADPPIADRIAQAVFLMLAARVLEQSPTVN